jgi:hypothetical protein
MPQLDQVDIRTAPQNLNREQVLQRIVDISEIPLPLMSRIGRDTHTNPFFEWPVDRLQAPDTTNVVADGSTAPAPTNNVAYRVGNHSQISQKTVGTSTRLETLNTVGNEGLARQVQKATQELQRDMEAMLLLNQINVLDGGAGGTAGRTAGLEAWLDLDEVDGSTVKSPASVFATTGTGVGGTLAVGGWSERTGNILDLVDYTSLTALGALSFGDVKDMLNALYQLGANPTVLMGRPNIIKALSSFMFDSTAQIATLQRNEQGSGSATAVASTNTIITDFGIVVDMVDNRLMQQTDSSAGTPPLSDTLFAFDPSYLSVSMAGGGIRSKELPVSGLGRAIQIHADYGLCVKNQEAVGAILALDDTAAAEA